MPILITQHNTDVANTAYYFASLTKALDNDYKIPRNKQVFVLDDFACHTFLPNIYVLINYWGCQTSRATVLVQSKSSGCIMAAEFVNA